VLAQSLTPVQTAGFALALISIAAAQLNSATAGNLTRRRVP
jgi:hypothetical protein